MQFYKIIKQITNVTFSDIQMLLKMLLKMLAIPYLMIIMLCAFSVVSFLGMGFENKIYADSLWEASEMQFYNRASKKIRVGDIVKIFITESSSAVQEASTRTSKESGFGTNFLTNWDQVASLLGNESIRKGYELDLQGQDQYRGAGQTTRRTKVQSVVSAVVTEILESGNLYVVGEHKIKVNNEVETIRIAGVVRPQDVGPDNSVQSNQVAKKEVSVNGVGDVATKQTPGLLTKMFNWLF